MRVVRAVAVSLLLTAVCAAQTQAPATRAWAAMVTIRGTAENGDAVSGSGFLVSSQGTIVTNLHLVKGLKKPQIELSNGDVFDALTVVNSDARRDLAIVRIAGFDLPYIELGNSNQVQTGDAVMLVAAAKQPISTGTVRGLIPADGFRLIQTSVTPQATADGGLLINANGQAIGVLGYRSHAETAVAVPINYARGLLESASEIASAAAQAPPAEPAAARNAVSAAPAASRQPRRTREAIAAPPAAAQSTAVAPARPAEVAAAPPQSAPQAAAAEVADAAPPRAVPPHRTLRPAPELARSAPVRKIYIASLGKGDGPDMLREKIAHTLQQNHFLIVDSPGQADAVLSGVGQWSHLRVKKFRARLVDGGERVLWSGEVSSGGWIRSASSSIADKLVENLMRALAYPDEQQ